MPGKLLALLLTTDSVSKKPVLLVGVEKLDGIQMDDELAKISLDSILPEVSLDTLNRHVQTNGV